MSEWLDYVKAYAEKNKITYKQALKDASPSYKTRNEKKTEEPAATSGRLVGGSTSNKPKIETPLEKEKTKRKSNKKVVENITLKL